MTTPDPIEDTAGLSVVCETAGTRLVVPPGTSILDAARQAGLDVTAPCADALCGACETWVLEGRPDHRDALLSAEEQARGETMLICVSRGRTPLVLDL
ncbi:2Fe-2S iron-sulfur cluster binding domain-containing protein [Blastococcus sp. TBT05-19]|uniref:2Fe-2S iron-sulfur cluster-binding protein n=1 Tax=Blastococcus sp. TBT05-19 TaxID=2250581 RepID=UPI001F25E9F3|nr:2Fe-2S iron-sulfur cluster binding domain-containing protein [Blastococcus sp. TBT05-19]